MEIQGLAPQAFSNAASCFDEARRLHTQRGDRTNNAVSAILWLGRGLLMVREQLHELDDIAGAECFPRFSFWCLDVEQVNAAMSGTPVMELDWIMRQHGHFERVSRGLDRLRSPDLRNLLVDIDGARPIHVENPYLGSSAVDLRISI